MSEASSRPNSEPLSPVFGDQGGRRDASGASFSTAAREEEEEVCKGPRRRREMLTTPGSFGGRLGDLGCWRCELAGWLAGSGVTGAADSDSSCLDGAAAAASRLPPKPPRFSPRAAACLRGHNSRGRARISSCNGACVGQRHGGAARVPVYLRRRRHGVPALGYATSFPRPRVTGQPFSSLDYSRGSCRPTGGLTARVEQPNLRPASLRPPPRASSSSG